MSCIYFIQSGSRGPIKIGVARNVVRRCLSLQTSHHRRLRILGTMEGTANEEANLHARFAAYRIRGEWFTASKQIIDYIKTLATPWAGAQPTGSRKPALLKCQRKKEMIAVPAETAAKLREIAYSNRWDLLTAIDVMVDEYLANHDATRSPFRAIRSFKALCGVDSIWPVMPDRRRTKASA